VRAIDFVPLAASHDHGVGSGAVDRTGDEHVGGVVSVEIRDRDRPWRPPLPPNYRGVVDKRRRRRKARARWRRLRTITGNVDRDRFRQWAHARVFEFGNHGLRVVFKRLEPRQHGHRFFVAVQASQRQEGAVVRAAEKRLQRRGTAIPLEGFGRSGGKAQLSREVRGEAIGRIGTRHRGQQWQRLRRASVVRQQQSERITSTASHRRGVNQPSQQRFGSRGVAFALPVHQRDGEIQAGFGPVWRRGLNGCECVNRGGKVELSHQADGAVVSSDELRRHGSVRRRPARGERRERDQ
jgi:hypothetical protein